MKNNTGKTFVAIILSIIILIISQIVSELLASGLILIKIPEYICNIVASILYIIISYHLLKILCKKYLKCSLKEYSIPKFKINLKWIMIGFILPLSIIGIYLLLPGTLVSSFIDLTKKLNILTTGIFFSGISAGIVEEMVFRGIIMNSLDKRYGKKVAILLPSILFGIVHILGMNFDIFSSLLVIVAGTMVGVMFSLITLEHNSIWDSAIVHILWNIVILGGVMNIGNSVSEYAIYNYLLDTKSFFITGGEFGIESSVIALIGYIVVILITLVMQRRNHKYESNIP